MPEIHTRFPPLAVTLRLSIVGTTMPGERREPHVLVVEDDEDAREALVALLQMKGYHAASAGNGREALDYLHRAPKPDLIILDLWMPIMNGWQFREQQIRDPRLADVPVIVVTALSDRTDVNANEVIIKPVDVDRLLSTVGHYCGREGAR